MSCVFQHVKEFWTNDGVEKLRKDLGKIPPLEAQVSSGMREDYRSVAARNFSKGYDWILDPVTETVAEANKQWGFDIVGIAEDLQYLVYKEGDQYKRHLDIHIGDLSTDIPNRKITFIIQLSDSDSYEGCDLMLDGGTEPEPIPRGKGDLIMFPSWLAHWVEPCIKGERHSIVGWIAGPHWR